MLISEFAEDGTPVSQLTTGSMRRVRVRCDGENCDKETSITWSNYLQGQRARGETAGKTYCQPCATRVAGNKKRGRPNPAVAAANAARTREKHGAWRGGRYVDREGYVQILVTPPNGGGGSYRKEHLLVMERHLGRALRPDEVVHHIDNDKQNNALSNLFLTNSVGHRVAHVSLVLSLMLLRSAGLVPAATRATAANAWACFRTAQIRFDATQGIYMANLKLRELREHPTGNSRGQSAAKRRRNAVKVQRLGHGVQTGQ